MKMGKLSEIELFEMALRLTTFHRRSIVKSSGGVDIKG